MLPSISIQVEIEIEIITYLSSPPLSSPNRHYVPLPLPLPLHPPQQSRIPRTHPNPQALTPNPDLSHNSSTGVDYEPHSENSVQVSPERKAMVESICRLYSGSASEGDMQVYAAKAVYDDPWSYCDTRFKIAGQWYGIPKIMATSRTLKTEIVSSTEKELVFKLQQEYRPKAFPTSKAVNSLVSLAIERDEQGTERVVYHKDMWNEKDYSHEGLGKVMKTLNGDHLTKITQPPKSL